MTRCGQISTSDRAQNPAVLAYRFVVNPFVISVQDAFRLEMPALVDANLAGMAAIVDLDDTQDLAAVDARHRQLSVHVALYDTVS